MELYESSHVKSAWDDQIEADAWMQKVLELEKQNKYIFLSFMLLTIIVLCRRLYQWSLR